MTSQQKTGRDFDKKNTHTQAKSRHCFQLSVILYWLDLSETLLICYMPWSRTWGFAPGANNFDPNRNYPGCGQTPSRISGTEQCRLEQEVLLAAKRASRRLALLRLSPAVASIGRPGRGHE